MCCRQGRAGKGRAPVDGGPPDVTACVQRPAPLGGSWWQPQSARQPSCSHYHHGCRGCRPPEHCRHEQDGAGPARGERRSNDSACAWLAQQEGVGAALRCVPRSGSWVQQRFAHQTMHKQCQTVWVESKRQSFGPAYASAPQNGGTRHEPVSCRNDSSCCRNTSSTSSSSVPNLLGDHEQGHQQLAGQSQPRLHPEHGRCG